MDALSEEPIYKKQIKYWKLAPLMDAEVSNAESKTAKIFFAGAVASASSKSIGSPLARITILLQTQLFTNKHQNAIQIAQQIVQQEGWRGFFRGNGVDVARSTVYGGFNYMAYEFFKRTLRPHDTSQSGVYSKFFAGGLSGIAALLLTYPLDVMRTKLVVQTDMSAYDQVRQLVQGDWRTFYRGLGVACTAIFPNLAINFAIFELGRNQLAHHGYSGLFYSLSCGVFAITCANTITFPLDVVIRNMQLDTKSGVERKYRNAWHCAKIVHEHFGVAGFYRGLLIQLLKSIPVGASSFAIYDTMRKMMNLEIN